MKALKKYILLGIVALTTLNVAAQCPRNNTIVSGAPLAPVVGGWGGWVENFPFTSGIASGEAVEVDVCLGATYTFTMCDNLLVIGDPIMTMYNAGSGALIAWNDDNTILAFPGSLLPQITWTATFTGTVELHIDQSPGCTEPGGDWMDVIVYQLSNCGIGGGPATPCNADIGTFTNTQNGNPVISPVSLCRTGADCLSFVSNDDWILPPPAANNPYEVPELVWALYIGPPSGVNPTLDPNYSGLTWTGDDWTDCNPSAFGLTGTWWFVPCLVDDSDNAGDPNGVFNFDQDGDGCIDVGVAEAMQVNYLNAITFSTSSSSCNGTVSITVSGGEPEFIPGNYTITNTGNGTLTGAPIGHGGTVTITGLTNGQAWSILVVDANGCTNTINGVFSGDITPPAITCPGNIVVNNDPGLCSAVVSWLVPVGTDNCPGPITTQTLGLAPGSAFPVGTTTIQYTVTDAIGNSVNCSFTVTVNDTENPTISCPANIVVNNDPGLCSAVVNWVAPVGSDNCPGVGTAQTLGPASGSAFPVGSTTIQYTVTDASGNSVNCSFSVTVNDTEDPTISCPANIVVNNDPGLCSAVVNWVAPVGADNCPGAGTVQTLGPASGSAFPIGTTTVQYTVTDAAGNSVNCSFTVTVNDTEPPTISCPANIVVGNDPGLCSAIVNWAPPLGADNCGGSVTTQTLGPAPGSSFPVGAATTIQYTVTDAAGNSVNCSFTVTVNDTEAPIISCPANIVVSNDPGLCSAVVNWVAPVGTDNCPGVGTVQTLGSASGSAFPVGVSTIQYTVTDAAGNSVNCSFTITVNDTEAPVISCPANIVVNNDPGLCSAVVNWVAPVGTDNCPGVGTVQTLGSASGSAFPVGVTTIQYTVTDAAGNSVNCSFTITVNDTEDPVINCPANIAQCNPIATWTAPVGTDNCPGVGTVQTLGPASGSSFPVGVTTIQYTATDASGNSVNCQFTVEIYPQDDPSFTYASGTFCITGANPFPSSITTPGGTFSISAPGVINPATGEVNLAASGLGSFTITYNTTTAGFPCPNSTTFNITITAAPTAGFMYDQPSYCQDDPAPILSYIGASSGGTFTSTPAGLNLNSGTGAVDLILSTPGLYTVYNTIAAAGGCSAALDSTTIEIFQVDSAQFSYSPITYCESGTDPIAVPGVNQTLGGTYTITAPGVINAGDGTINLSASGPGTYTVYYNTTVVGNPCPSVDSVTITITPAPTAAFSYDALSYCQNDPAPILTIGVGSSSGTFTSTPAGLNLNSGTGAVDLVLSTPGLYTVYNTIAAAGGCALAIDSTTIEIFQVDSAQFSYATLTHCITGTDPVVIPGANQTPGGVYTISAPGVINAANGTVNLAASGLGTFTIYYNTTAAGNPCPSLDSVVINIVNAPGATFTYNTPFCEGDPNNPLPIFGVNDFAGVFSASPAGLVFVSTATGEIDLSLSGAGTYMIYNNLAASGGCAAALDSFQIVINPMYTVPQNAAVCQGDSILLGGVFQNSSGVYVDTLSSSLGCDSIIQTTLTINPVTTTPQNAAICQGDSMLLGGVFQTTPGVYNDTLVSNLGCDSIIETTLTVNTIILTQLTDSICQGDSILLGGAFQTLAGVYNDTLVAIGGCDSVVETTLSIMQLNTITPNPITPICASDSIILTATSSGTGTITWYSDPAGTIIVGTGSPLILPNPGIGNYTFYVNNVGNCPSNMDSVIVVVGGVTAVINAAPVTGSIPLSVFFGNGSTTGAGIVYAWDFGDGNTDNQFEPTNVYTTIGTYTAILIVTDGICFDTATVIIDAFGESGILIPNVFTPNGDGSNDIFTVDGVNLESVEGEIFNRWGQKMFSWDNVKGHWDGRTLSGSEAPDGTYFYIIKAKGFDGTEYFEKGGFSLIR